MVFTFHMYIDTYEKIFTEYSAQRCYYEYLYHINPKITLKNLSYTFDTHAYSSWH